MAPTVAGSCAPPVLPSLRYGRHVAPLWRGKPLPRLWRLPHPCAFGAVCIRDRRLTGFACKFPKLAESQPVAIAR